MDRHRLIREQGFQPGRGGIVIEDDVWIGANCVLLDCAVLRRVVGAGSLVRVNRRLTASVAASQLVPVDERVG